MDSLIGYGSEEENDDLSHSKRQCSSQADVNYEEVQMDLSEESSDSSRLESRHQSADDNRLKCKDYHSNLKSKEDVKKYQKSDDYKSKYEHTESKKDDRQRDRERRRNENEKRKNRDIRSGDDKTKDIKRDRYREEKSKYKEERVRESRKSREEQDQSRDKGYDSRDNNREDRRNYRTSERHRSRSPKNSDYTNKRSNSRDRNQAGHSKRYDRTTSKMDRLEKLGIELNTHSGFQSTSSNLFNNDQQQDKNRFYMPGITGRFTEQIQRRKLLWQKKEPNIEECPVEVPGNAVPTTKMWQNTTFAQDSDGKVANKFKRLMGIKGNENKTSNPAGEVLKKQEEMFNSMEAQYEVARTATHTMRGVGLGFGSFQR